MADYQATIGSVELVSLTDGHGDMDPSQIFPTSSMAAWSSEYPELLDDDGHIHLRFGCLAVRSSGKLIIVDTGLHAPDGTLLDEMNSKGVDRDAVDLVAITHLHPDHVGWNLIDGKPTFPNARYLVSKADYDHWTKPEVLENAQHVKDQVLPLESLNILDLMDDDYKITDELTTVATPGHTPGHVSIAVVSGGERAFILGDVAHSPAQAHYTEWSPSFDTDGDISRHTRHQILDKLEAEGTLVSAGHFPDQGFGRFVKSGGRRIWQGI